MLGVGCWTTFQMGRKSKFSSYQKRWHPKKSRTTRESSKRCVAKNGRELIKSLSNWAWRWRFRAEPLCADTALRRSDSAHRQLTFFVDCHCALADFLVATKNAEIILRGWIEKFVKRVVVTRDATWVEHHSMRDATKSSSNFGRGGTTTGWIKILYGERSWYGLLNSPWWWSLGRICSGGEATLKKLKTAKDAAIFIIASQWVLAFFSPIWKNDEDGVARALSHSPDFLVGVIFCALRGLLRIGRL